MTIETVKAEAPDVAAALRDEGVQAERKRVSALAAYKANGVESAKIADEAIASGKEPEELMSQFIGAMKIDAAMKLDGENAPAIASGIVTSGAAAEVSTVEGMTAEDVAACKKAGMTMDEIKACAPKGRL